ncbi:MAG: hypothetical protein ACI9TY_000453 [Alphaproteobacteria bacterium]|jgi:hypothetical protein
MKNIYILLAFLAVILSGAYFMMSDTPTEHSFSKGFQSMKDKISTLDTATPSTPVKKVIQKVNGCEVALEKFDIDNDCAEKSIIYAGKLATIVYITGADKENFIVLPDSRLVTLSTNLYYNAAGSIKAYVNKVDSIELDDEDLENASAELRIGKRGYLYSLNFVEPYSGSIYITPQGRISGHLKK